MAINLVQRARFDTRGLPEGYDAQKLFVYRHETFKPANGLESFAYKLMPPSVIRSIAFAIDPTARFQVSANAITPVQRQRKRATASVLDARYRTGPVYQRNSSQFPNYKGLAFCSSPYSLDVIYNSPQFRLDLPSQEVLPDYVKDTTARTRLLGSSLGELELFKHTLYSPPRSVVENRFENNSTDGITPFAQCSEIGGTTADHGVETEVRIYRNYFGHAAVFPLATYDALTAQEVNFNKSLALKYAPSMLKGISPFTRDYSLLRNAVELRDIPRSILQLQRTMENLRKVFDTFGRSKSTQDLIFDLKRSSKDIPNEYLSFHFGWRQTYKDLVELMALPEKVSKKINFLMSRSRKATTFRSKRDHLSSETGVSGFEYSTDPGFEYNIRTSSRLVRKSEIRLVVNAIFDFPPINVPSLARTYTWYDRVGVIPRFIDIYNLMPWTWLFDWFTGCGNYLELMEEINHDPSLINWGMMTVKTEGQLLTDLYSEVPQKRVIRFNNILREDSTVMKQYRSQSLLEYECQTRQDVATLYSVKRTSVPSSLTAYQYSILGALLAQRMGISRDKAFRPIS